MAPYRDSRLGICIDITGPDGNAFVLLGHFGNYMRQLGRSDKYITETRNRMMSGDYENLLNIFEEELGSVITLIGRS